MSDELFGILFILGWGRVGRLLFFRIPICVVERKMVVPFAGEEHSF